MSSDATTFSGATYNLVVPTGQTGLFNADARCDLYGTLTGGGAFTNTLGATTVWQDVVQPDSATAKAGITQSDGSTTVLTFTDAGAAGASRFYRILISP